MEEERRNRCYSRFAKAAVLCLQMICVVMVGFCGLMSVCLVSSAGDIEDLISKKPFEATSNFTTTVGLDIDHLSQYMRVQKLFETEGAFDEEKMVDIMQPDEQNQKKQNPATTYSVKDLNKMYQSVSYREFEFIINESEYYESEQAAIAGESAQVREYNDVLVELEGYSEQFVMLYQEGKPLEQWLPASGVTLADYAKENSKTVSLRDMYMQLYSVLGQFEEYLDIRNEVKNAGNFRFLIRDTASGAVYASENWETNLDKAWQEAEKWKFSLRYTRTSEKVNFEKTNNESEEWLKNHVRAQSFTGNDEEVILGINTEYPEMDLLQENHEFYSRYQSFFLPFVIIAIISLLCGIACFVIATVQTGRSEKNGVARLNGFDRIPTEAAAAIVCIAAVLTSGVGLQASNGVSSFYHLGSVLATVLVMLIGAMFFMWACLSLVRRIKRRTLWGNSLTKAIIDICKKVYAARTSSKRLMIAFVVFFLLHIFLIGTLSGIGILIAVIVDVMILLVLLKDVAGRQTVREGLAYIAAGNLDFKIDVSNLQGDNLEMAEEVNHVGDGLQNAVEKSMKNERLKSELITNVSHDIKTPLTSIINYVDLLKREEIEDEKIKGYIDILDVKSQRLKQLTEDLVEASKVSSGNIDLQMSRIQMQELLRQAYGEFAEKFRSKNLEIIFNAIEEPAVIWADGRQLWRIFENLLNNIAKYALSGTRVYIELRIINKKAVLLMKNISEQALNITADELTERFMRGDSSRTTEGSGLGLSIAKSLTELQKGMFEIYLDGDLFKVTVSFDLMESQ